uniref:ATP-dependent DNA helicase n=1 Tax=Caenorhabditis japonica TaxID=281687 RepID=A0A8R1EVR5_CAEJA
MGTIFKHVFGSTKLNRSQEELNQGVQIAVCNSLATTPSDTDCKRYELIIKCSHQSTSSESRFYREGENDGKDQQLAIKIERKDCLKRRKGPRKEEQVFKAIPRLKEHLKPRSNTLRDSHTIQPDIGIKRMRRMQQRPKTHLEVGDSSDADNFQSNIRQFNSALALASMGAQVEEFRDYGPLRKLLISCFETYPTLPSFSCQILSVIRRGTKTDLINNCIKNSYLWNQFQKFSLLDNMRIINGDANWIKFLLDVGDGVANYYEDRVTLLEGLPVLEDLVDDVFGGLRGDISDAGTKLKTSLQTNT